VVWEDGAPFTGHPSYPILRWRLHFDHELQLENFLGTAIMQLSISLWFLITTFTASEKLSHQRFWR